MPRSTTKRRTPTRRSAPADDEPLRALLKRAAAAANAAGDKLVADWLQKMLAAADEPSRKRSGRVLTTHGAP